MLISLHPVTVLQYFQSRLLPCDNRWQSNLSYLFWATSLTEKQKLSEGINIAARIRSSNKRIQHPNVKKSSKPRTLQHTFNDLLSNIQKPLGIHHICTILFSLPVNYLKQRVLKVLFYVNILQCFFVVENLTANAVSVAIGDNFHYL
jgi:hypothetical protein